MGMTRHRLKGRHACAIHTEELVQQLGALVPFADEEDTPVQPADLADWVLVEAEVEPEIADHGWRIDLADEVGLLVDPDGDDIATLLGEQVGVRSVVQLDREVLVVSAPSLCAEGLRAATVQAIAAVNERARHPGPTGQPWPTGPRHGESPRTGSPSVGHAETQAARAPEDDYAPRLVTGDARARGQRLQIWVNQDGILVLPAGTVPHGPLDPSDNPRFQRATFNSAEAARLAEQNAGRWIPYPSLGELQLRRPGAVRHRWRATITEARGAPVSFSWRGTRPHAMLFWVYAVAKCGPDQVDGLP